MAHRIRIAALLGVAVLSAGGVATAAPAAATDSAKKPVETFLFTNDQVLTSSTGIRLQTFVTADSFSSGEADAGVGLARRGEDHDWSLPVSRTTFSFSHRTGKGSVVTGTQLGGLGALTLKLSRRGPTRTKTCPGGDFSQRTPVTVSGSLTVDPHSATWGTIGSAAQPQTYSVDALVESDHGRVENDCFDGHARPSCPAERDWNGPSDQPVFLTGGWVRRHGTRHGFIQAERTVSIDGTGGFRDDSFERAAPVPSIVRHRGVARVRVSTRGVVGATGSATLQSVGKPTTQTFGCGHHTSERQQTWTASYRNGRTPLTVASAVGRPFRVHDSRRSASLTFTSGRAAIR
jgi:hypothetical protein